MAGYIFFFVTNYSMYSRIKTNFPFDQSLRAVLIHSYDYISANIRFQERVALYIYPIAAASGFLMGGASGGDLEVMLQKKSVLLILLITVIILTPRLLPDQVDVQSLLRKVPYRIEETHRRVRQSAVSIGLAASRRLRPLFALLQAWNRGCRKSPKFPFVTFPSLTSN